MSHLSHRVTCVTVPLCHMCHRATTPMTPMIGVSLTFALRHDEFVIDV